MISFFKISKIYNILFLLFVKSHIFKKKKVNLLLKLKLKFKNKKLHKIKDILYSKIYFKKMKDKLLYLYYKIFSNNST